MAKRGRIAAVLTVAVGVAVIIGAGALLSADWMREYRWIRALRTGDEATRRDAAARLAEIRSARSVEALAELFARETGADEEAGSLNVVGYVGPGVPAHVEDYVVIPGHGMDYVEVHYACNALREIGAPAVPVLARFLSHSNPFIRIQAAGALARLGPQARDAVDALIAVLPRGHSETAHDTSLVLYAALSLAGIGCEAKAAMPVLQGARNETFWGEILAAVAEKILIDCGESCGKGSSDRDQDLELLERTRECFLGP